MLGGLGLLDAPATDTTAYLWPENVLAWHCWCAVQTQWRTGMAGITGLDYAGVRAWLLDAVPSDEDRRDVWAGITACEHAVLECMAERREREEAQQQTPLAQLPARM